MKILLKWLLLQILLFALVSSHDPFTETPQLEYCYTEKISPDIVNELKDFEHLIPAAKIDAIVAEHLVVDGNFRKAIKYLRSNDFKLFQKQLINVPEIIAVLEFLHMTVNATDGITTSSAATATYPLPATLHDDDNGIDKITTNIVTTGTGGNSATGAITMKLGNQHVLAYKSSQLDELMENRVDVVADADAASSDQLEPLVDIVLLDAKLREASNHKHTMVGVSKAAKHHRRAHRRRQIGHPLGSFTSFVEEVLAQLPHDAYQHMITDKCKKNANFAAFYKALRSPEFKPLVDEAMKTDNIKKILSTLNSHDIDVKSLEPIGLRVISWGPNV